MSTIDMAPEGGAQAPPVPSAARPSPTPGASRFFVATEWTIRKGVHARAALTELGVEGQRDVRLGRGYLLPPELTREQRSACWPNCSSIPSWTRLESQPR